MQIGELALELHQGMIIAGDVARAARTGAESGRGFDQRTDYLRMLPQAEPMRLPRVLTYVRARACRE